MVFVQTQRRAYSPPMLPFQNPIFVGHCSAVLKRRKHRSSIPQRHAYQARKKRIYPTGRGTPNGRTVENKRALASHWRPSRAHASLQEVSHKTKTFLPLKKKKKGQSSSTGINLLYSTPSSLSPHHRFEARRTTRKQRLNPQAPEKNPIISFSFVAPCGGSGR